MLFYRIDAETVKNDETPAHSGRGGNESAFENVFEKLFQSSNQKVYLFIASIKRNRVAAGAFVRDKKTFEDSLDCFWQSLQLDIVSIKTEETTIKGIRSLLRDARRSNYIIDNDLILQRFGLDNNSEPLPYHIKVDFSEYLVNIDKGKKEMLKKSKRLLCDETLSPEIERIYKGAQKEISIGHPVHYMIESDSHEVQDEMMRILLGSLYLNKRILSRRYIVCTVNARSCFKKHQFEDIYQLSEGGTVVIRYEKKDDEENEYADMFVDNLSIICKTAHEYKSKVLTVLCLPQNDEKIKRDFTDGLDSMMFVFLNEATASSESAKNYLRSLAKEKKIAADRSLYTLVSEPKKSWMASELDRLFESWVDSRMRKTYYPQYQALEAPGINTSEREIRNTAWDELQKMVGLSEAKSLIAQAVDYYKAQKLFENKGMKTSRVSMHMVFTGNPGTAKTTVARLFARIMYDNGLLMKGELIEVGRADLVGKYVGWTAKIVKERFAQAKGGVLFIDEAYSLVDDKNGLFGDEAINTIVQEMENHRDDTVVIFAGYPEKMEEFLRRNPGLRSRIAFHLPFADYSTDELLNITELIAESSGMTLAPDVSDKLKLIIETAIKTPGFGNGRFARNLVEKAKMKQASRLVRLGYDAVSEKDIRILTADDFDVPELMTEKAEKRILGFSA